MLPVPSSPAPRSKILHTGLSALTIGLLTRHPPHFSTESEYPYLLRLTGKNGYPTPSSLLTFCGIRPPALSPSIDVSKLASAANTTKKALTKIGYKSGHQRTQTRLLGHKIRPHDLRLTKPQICVFCIEDRRFIEAHFDLAIMVACPVHRIKLVSSCHQCNEPLTWLRPDLLECRCGAQLKPGSRGRIDEALGDLLDLIRRKVLGLSIPDSYPSKIPAIDLGRMKLWNLLYLIDILGRRSRVGLLPVGDSAAIALRASYILSDWPRRFFTNLQEFAQGDWDETGVPLTRGGLRSLYFALMFGIKPRGESFFLRKALSEFASSRHGIGSLDPALRRLNSNGGDQFLPKSRLAQEIGISRRMLDRLIKGNRIDVVRTTRGEREHIWIATSNVNLAKLEGKVYGAPEAARKSGIPQPLLKELKKSGLYCVAHLPQGSRGYHERDIQDFIARVKSHARPRSNQRGPMISLGQVIRHRHLTKAAKAKLVRNILQDEIPVFGHAKTPLEQLLVPRNTFLSFKRSETAQSIALEYLKSGRVGSGNPLTAQEVAKVLGCCTQAVSRLVAAGHLNGTRRHNALWVDGASVQRFHQEYVRMAAVAAELASDSGALINVCLNSRISMIVFDVPGGGRRHAFVLRRHVIKLRQRYFQQKKMTKK